MANIECFDLGDLITNTPYPDAAYRELDAVKDRPIYIMGAVAFENQKGKGVHILAREPNGDEFRLCTHSVAITNQLTNPKVQEVFEKGGAVKATIVHKKSSTTGRLMYALTSGN